MDVLPSDHQGPSEEGGREAQTMLTRISPDSHCKSSHRKDKRRACHYPNVKSLAEHFSRMTTGQAGMTKLSMNQVQKVSFSSRRNQRTSPQKSGNLLAIKAVETESSVSNEYSIECENSPQLQTSLSLLNKEFSSISLNSFHEDVQSRLSPGTAIQSVSVKELRWTNSYVHDDLGNSLTVMSISENERSLSLERDGISDWNADCMMDETDARLVGTNISSCDEETEDNDIQSNSSSVSDSTGSTITYVTCQVDKDCSQDMNTIDSNYSSASTWTKITEGSVPSPNQLLHPDWRKVPWKHYFGWTDSHQMLHDVLLQQGQSGQSIYFANLEEYETVRVTWDGSDGHLLNGPTVSSVSEMLQVMNSFRVHGSGSI